MQIHPVKFAMQRQSIQGEYPMASMARLSSTIGQELVGLVRYELQGEIDDVLKIPYLQLQFQATLPLQCQRCLKPMSIMVEHESRLSPVFSEDAAEKLPAEYDPLELSVDELNFADLLEDELLLLVPSVPLHALSDCSVKETSWVYEDKKETNSKENPFAKLKKLKEE